MSAGLKAAAFGLFAASVVGAGLGVADFLDARVQFCNASTNPCTQRVVPAWAELPKGRKFERFLPGAAGQKLFGAVLGVFGFTGSMMVCRLLAEQESIQQRFKGIADADALQRYATRVNADFQAYTHEANLRAAEVAYAVLEPYQQPLLEGDTLNDITSPGDKLGSTVNFVFPPEDADKYAWILEAVNYCSVLVFGGQKSGKTTLASHVIQRKKQRGDRIIVLDPHAALGQWNGLEVVGAGMDYDAIDKQLDWYYKECAVRYQILATKGVESVNKLQRICLVTEEFTNYSSRCQNAKEYLQAAMSDNRKILMDSLMISHNNTLTTLGGAKGIAQLKDDAMLEVKLIPPTGVSPRQAFLKLPGQDFKEVPLPNWETITNFSDPKQQQPPSESERERLDRYMQMEAFPSGDRTPTQPEQTTPKLSAEVQKVIAWVGRKHQEGLEWLTVEQCRASGCVQGAKTTDVKAYFDEIVGAKIGVLNDRGDIRLA